MKSVWILILFTFCCATWAQEGLIKGVTETPRNTPLAKSGIIDTMSGLKFELDELAMLLWMERNGGSADRLDALIRIVLAMDKAALDGTNAVQRYLSDDRASAATRLDLDQISQLVKPVADAYEQIAVLIDDHGLTDLEDSIEAAMQGVPPGENYFIRLSGTAFQVAGEYAKGVRAELFLNSVDATILLRHLRDPDNSVRREVQFMEPLNPDDKKAWNQLLEARSQTGGDPNKLEKLLTEKTLKLAVGFFQDLRDEIDRELRQIQDELDAVTSSLKALALDQEAKFGMLHGRSVSIQNFIVAFPDTVEALIDNIRSVSDEEVQDPSIALTDLASQTNAIVISIATLTTDVTLLVADVVAAIADSQEALEQELRELATNLRAVWKNVETASSRLTKNAQTMFVHTVKATLGIFNLNAVMKEIGRSVKPWPTNGIVEYKNVGGRLSGLQKPLVSGDELLFEIWAAPPGTDELTTLESKRIYVYKMGLRTDRVFYLALSERTDGSAWRFAPTYSDVFVRGTRSSLYANRLGAIGIGSAISLLDQNGDDAFELGFGVVVSLLDHRLLFGYGFNTTLNRGYTFIGWRFRLG